ncbi:hypothetical protein G8S49_06545 [Clostridium botulinum C]|uniref:Uncharacterized protein n=1 Tax=Clostridium botulinum C TaxID=36828 RepID=A0A9Q3Z0A0_CLOBO|nr:hypothetical protein [Clostridium botulinum]YP_398465.1 hypothetical protein CST035 [Clostridium phage c-st]MCD3196059.1 hypothetical protein [Clostridium botulinum C]MCD3200350.1 hypothetical protein [Clostridium botulinum C]MCD3206883.1 hypothetical protein [Clostridium botulinum C]MCD3207582.1 hypothetical protein [Clostridium botulinum C]MCD3226316.1 hypothetical protein [Clostridium botulinum C]
MADKGDILLKNIQQKTMSCTNKNCKRIYDLNYKIVLDSFIEYKCE